MTVINGSIIATFQDCAMVQNRWHFEGHKMEARDIAD